MMNITRNNVFNILQKEYNKNTKLRNKNLIKKCFLYFDNSSWLNLTKKEQKILVSPILKNEINKTNKDLYESLFINARYVDSHFENNRYIWDTSIWDNNNLQELRESILENNNDCDIYSLINSRKMYIVKSATKYN